jgi:hypothetical protein
MNLVKTQRSYNNHFTKVKYSMFQDSNTHQSFLINERNNDTIRNFVLCAHNDITYKFQDGTILEIPRGEFLEISTDNPPTHKKYTGIQKRFTKI